MFHAYAARYFSAGTLAAAHLRQRYRLSAVIDISPAFGHTRFDAAPELHY